MNLSQVGLTLPTAGQTNSVWSSSGKNLSTTNGKGAKPQYLTVQEGDYVYTYLVIGDHIKVLIGRTAANKEEDEQEEKEQKENEQDKLSGIDADAADQLTVAANQAAENQRKLLEYTSAIDVETFLQCRQTVRSKQQV